MKLIVERNDELYHYGRKGMKWGKNIFTEPSPRKWVSKNSPKSSEPKNYTATNPEIGYKSNPQTYAQVNPKYKFKRKTWDPDYVEKRGRKKKSEDPTIDGLKYETETPNSYTKGNFKYGPDKNPTVKGLKYESKKPDSYTEGDFKYGPDKNPTVKGLKYESKKPDSYTEGKFKYDLNENKKPEKPDQQKKDPNKEIKDLNNTKGLVDSSKKAVDSLNETVKRVPVKKERMDLDNMSDKELRDRINREYLERQYNDLFAKPSNAEKGKEIASNVLSTVGTVLGVASSALGIAVAIKQLMK